MKTLKDCLSFINQFLHLFQDDHTLVMKLGARGLWGFEDVGGFGALGAQGAKVHKRAWWIKVLGNLGMGSLGGTAWELGALGANFGGQGDYGV